MSVPFIPLGPAPSGGNSGDPTGADLNIDGHNLEEAMRLVLAGMRGNLQGAGTGTETIMAADGSKPRIVATVDSFGNRTITASDAS